MHLNFIFQCYRIHTYLCLNFTYLKFSTYLVPRLSFNESSYTVEEDQGKLRLTLVLSHPASQDMDVKVDNCSKSYLDSNIAESKSFLVLYVTKLSKVCMLLAISDI